MPEDQRVGGGEEGGNGEVIADSIVMYMCGVRGLVGSTCGKKRGKKNPVGRGGGEEGI